MSLLDVVVVLAAAVAAWTGWRSGGLHTVVGVACRLAGLIIGVGVADWVATASWGFPARVITEIVVLLLGWVLGGRLAAWLGPAPRPAGRVAGPDRVLGVGVRAALTLLVGALGIQALALWGPPAVRADAAHSALPGVIAQVGPVGLPRLGQLATNTRDVLPADLNGMLPQTGPVNDQRVATPPAAAQAVVAVTATHAGSPITSTGTGFFVTGGHLVTAEHVVAGASAITISRGGYLEPATVAVADVGNDLAVLTVADPPGTGLPVATQPAQPGTPAVFVGYPDGGPQQARAATVVGGVAMPTGPWDAADYSLRPAYRLRTLVRPGNSGGPLLDSSGAVIGVIDAHSLVDPTVGYAITAAPLRTDLGPLNTPAPGRQ
jgi:S1-C subfamily serine protease